VLFTRKSAVLINAGTSIKMPNHEEWEESVVIVDKVHWIFQVRADKLNLCSLLRFNED
jgi:hypothetical protein